MIYAQVIPPTPRSGGGGSPRSVIRGEFKPKIAVSIDYIALTFQGVAASVVVREACKLLGVPDAEDRCRGFQGYAESVDVGGFGLVAFGGEDQRDTVHLSVPGQGCARIASFGAVRCWAEGLGARITRLDIAADDVTGESLHVRRALRAWKRGGFDRQGTACKARIVDDLGSGDGSTLYIGSRGAGKFCRVYEKGRQLGDVLSRWVRAEVEFRAVDRLIPWDAVTNPLPYFAGSYPYWSRFSLEEMRLRTFKSEHALTLAQLVSWARDNVGKTINAMLEESGGDIGAVVFALRRNGVPRRLEQFVSAPILRAA